MIKLKNVTFSYEKDSPVFKNFTYTFNSKKIYLITGENGKGKTTLLKIILGLIKPDDGVVDLEPNMIVGYLPDYNGIYENMSLIDNVRFRLGIYNKNLNNVKDDFYLYIRKFKLEEYLNKLVKDMSLGTKKKVALLCVMLINPDLLVLDEPTGGLDQESKKILYDFLKELNGKMTIIMVTHDYEIMDYIECEIVKI